MELSSTLGQGRQTALNSKPWTYPPLASSPQCPAQKGWLSKQIICKWVSEWMDKFIQMSGQINEYLRWWINSRANSLNGEIPTELWELWPTQGPAEGSRWLRWKSDPKSCPFPGSGQAHEEKCTPPGPPPSAAQVRQIGRTFLPYPCQLTWNWWDLNAYPLAHPALVHSVSWSGLLPNCSLSNPSEVAGNVLEFP